MSSETVAHNGLPGPRGGTPARVPGSVRRTTSVDLSRPDGPDGPVQLVGRARDLVTRADGSTVVLDRALLRLTVADGRVTRLRCHPHRPDAAGLVGRPAVVGWRTGLWRLLRSDVEGGSPLHQLLDDLPGAMIVGGFTRRRALAELGGPVPQPGRRLDVCAGWAADSWAARVLEQTGTPPPPATPPAPAMSDDTDPMGWHTLPQLPRWGLSRRRRVEVVPADDEAQVEATLRDSFVDAEGTERVLHEVWVSAGLDRQARLRDVRADPRVLPHRECPLAAASAGRLDGAPGAQLRDRVSATLYGPSTCTHLNDVLRSMADAPALWRQGVGATG